MIVGLCIVIMTILAVLNIILGGAWSTASTYINVDNSAIINGTVSDYDISSTMYFNIDPLTGFIALLTGIVAIACVWGIQAFGTGLSDSTARIASWATLYSLIWTELSIFGWSLITSIPVFGLLIWTVLTLAYGLGVAQKIESG
jgi:hypothetical protein